MEEKLKSIIEERFSSMGPEERNHVISNLKDITHKGIIEDQAREIRELKHRVEELLRDLSEAKTENTVLRSVIGEMLQTILDRR